jgi:tetratricopeptide (TPR) repeat protein
LGAFDINPLSGEDLRHVFAQKKEINDMTSPSVSYISRTLLSILFIVCLVSTQNPVRAQEYTEEEYKAFQDIQAQKDYAKKTDVIIKFLKANPKSALRPNIAAEYQKMIVDLQKEKNWSELITLGDKLLNIAPNDEILVAAMAAAYSATNNTRGFATFGEKAYAAKPSGQLALWIAKAYQSLGNQAKFLQWGEKALAADPDNVEMLSDMTRGFMAMQNAAQALKYAKMSLKALPNAKKPDSMDAQTWKNTVNVAYATAYGVIGANAYQNRDYSGAIKNLDNAVRYFKNNETAYYYLGMSYWQQNKLDAAMLNFAKAYILKGSTASSAKQYLDQLYKSSHRNSLAGEERVIQRAEQDLK